ncbi:MAG: hypothetical protein KAS75_05750 [Planctomycetes bacterium]|nr:hypothetical protein [Planctomycetota bacterium]
MYNKRIKIFVLIIASLLLVCLLRLIQMQLLVDSSLQDEITKLKLQRGHYRLLKTLRGKILDRKGQVLAIDEPRFQLCISYELTRFFDERVQRAKFLKASKKENPELALSKVQEEIKNKFEVLQQIIEKCSHFGFEHDEIENKIKKINDSIWNLRTHLAWKRNYPEQDFSQAVPDVNERILLAFKVDIAEMHKNWPLLELETDDDIFTAQLEFSDIDGIGIQSKSHRVYPFKSVAAQTIGWVGLATQKEDRQLFAGDRRLSYQSDEVCGREDGVEYVCETALRGKRGEEVYDINRELQNRVETEFGKDVHLTLDIELQQRIENYLVNCNFNSNCKAPTSAVIIDVATGDILAMVSMPDFDLNRARYDYGSLYSDSNEPLRNRAINKQYPPGSVVKPLILIAAIESGKGRPSEIVNCPARKAPKGWPSCWLYNRYRSGHDDRWQNNARNAIKGSCNIYFSRLANRLKPSVLQEWLFKFGYGHKISLAPPAAIGEAKSSRDFRQAQGQISNTILGSEITDFNEVPLLTKSELRYFGIGQGNLRVTPLQVANAMAIIARGGLYKKPRLFIDGIEQTESIALNISKETLDMVYDGMSAVVNESGGTAYKEFSHAGFSKQGIMVYGKTGSTERPDHAWFSGFAEDNGGHSVAIAVVVEGGQHGSSDAGSLAREMIQFCIEAGYIGRKTGY